jgi:hypothetical protein
MKTQTPNPRTTTPQTANHMTAEGKTKAPTDMPALSLQDVFPESVSTTASHQETNSLFEIEQEKGAQLQKGKDQKKPKSRTAGRKKLDASERRAVKLQLHVTQDEYDQLKVFWQASGQKFISDYLRRMVLDQGKAKNLINKSALIKQLDKTGTILSKIGSNINQLARYANIQMKTGKIDQRTLSRFNQYMEHYLEEQRNLVRAYRALTRNKE